MDIEFHYWGTALIAEKAGFTRAEAKVIAYASEYVDENDVCLKIEDKAGGKTYQNYICQTMNILKPKQELMRIYPLFHFVPGDPMAHSARRRDGKMHLLNTTPDGPVANEMLDEALKAHDDTRLYRIGIASHTYVDTWAHQNFVGWMDIFNNIGLNLKPDIGHADAVHHPDWVSHLWQDMRLVDADVNNLHRFLSAARALFNKYCEHLVTRGVADQRTEWPLLEKELMRLFGPTYSGDKPVNLKERLAGWKNRLRWLPAFDENVWFDEAIATNVHGMKDDSDGLLAAFTVFKDAHWWREDVDHTSTHWFRFQEAVKEHERLGIKLLRPLFDQIGLNIATV